MSAITRRRPLFKRPAGVSPQFRYAFTFSLHGAFRDFYLSEDRSMWQFIEMGRFDEPEYVSDLLTANWPNTRRAYLEWLATGEPR